MNLREFLKSKKALTKFKHNYHIDKNRHPDDRGSKIIEATDGKSVERYLTEGGSIQNAFSWQDTPERGSYWANLHREYV